MSNLRTDFTNSLADIIINDIQYKKSVWYNFLGKSEGYSYGSILPNVYSTQAEETDIRSEIVFYKKISSQAVSKYCNRYDWEINTEYEKWDHTKDMSDKKFYVVTEELGITRVYKCLDHRNGVLSIIKPTFSSLEPVRLADGYLWKYMYEIPSFKVKQFSNFSYIPVQKALSDGFYNKGSIESVIIQSAGEGYVDVNDTYIDVYDDGSTTGSGASANITQVTAVGGLISSPTGMEIISGGSGYSAGVNVKVISETGVGAVIEAIIDGGVVIDLTVVNPGAGYSISDTISFEVGGAVLVPNVNSAGEIVNVTIVNPGIGYISPPDLTVISPTGIAKYDGNETAIIDAIVSLGSVQRVTISDPGVGYAITNTTTISVEGDGHGNSNATAVIRPVVFDGRLIDTIIEDSGTGYTSATLDVDGVGSGAKIQAVFAASDFNSDQSVIEQIAVQGAIYSVNLTNIGSGYTNSNNVTVVIEGDGENAEGYAVIEDGNIVNVVMTSFGSGYSYANVSFIDSMRDNLNPFYENATGYGIIPPPGGHGSNSPKELYSKGVVIYSDIRDDSDLNYIDQDFRVYGLMKDPKDVYDKSLNSATELVTYTVTVNDASVFVKDQILIKENKHKYRILAINTDEIVLLPLGFQNISPTGELILESDISKSCNVNSINDTPNVNRLSGDMIFYKYEQPFQFDETQGMLIKTFISFDDLNNGFQ